MCIYTYIYIHYLCDGPLHLLAHMLLQLICHELFFLLLHFLLHHSFLHLFLLFIIITIKIIRVDLEGGAGVMHLILCVCIDVSVLHKSTGPCCTSQLHLLLDTVHCECVHVCV